MTHNKKRKKETKIVTEKENKILLHIYNFEKAFAISAATALLILCLDFTLRCIPENIFDPFAFTLVEYDNVFTAFSRAGKSVVKSGL